ncbi:RidA family protein [Bradyrhizobium canariense]|uniref:RidA family protein n=2 Tax=Bradyrhizobium canariense TaxID=255045 RepID=UPI003F7C376B
MSVVSCRVAAKSCCTQARSAQVSMSPPHRGAAALCADLCISAINHATGGEDKIVHVLQLVGYIASAPGFTQQSQVMNGASDRLIERLGDRGRHTRTSVGVAELPRGAPVELGMIAAVRS